MAIDAKTALDVAAESGSVTTANGGELSLSVVDGSLFINEAQVVVTDIATDNGIIHVIDKVLVPSD